MNYIINKAVYKFTIFSKMAECLKNRINFKFQISNFKFQILHSLDQDSHPTQRKLCNDLGVSLGKVNYCLKILIGKGFIKVDNFKNSNNKIQYSYLLTPKGVKEKAKLTLDFIRIKTQEYDTLKQEIESLKQEAKNMDAE